MAEGFSAEGAANYATYVANECLNARNQMLSEGRDALTQMRGDFDASEQKRDEDFWAHVDEYPTEADRIAAEEARAAAEAGRVANEEARELRMAAVEGARDSGELDGATFVPSVTGEGILSWSNDRGRPNPEPADIRGPKGDTGDMLAEGEVLPLGHGGTGADNAADAREMLGIVGGDGIIPLSLLPVTVGTDDPPATGTPNTLYVQLAS